MDINAWRIAFTLVSFVIFLGIVFWAMSRRNRQAFDEAAMLPFADEPRMGGRHE